MDLLSRGVGEVSPATHAVALDGTTRIDPQGPGAVFASPRAAALDALAWCFLESRDRPLDRRRARGGAIKTVAGGFSYDEPTLERRGTRVLAYPLRSTDVAHFRHVPVRRWPAHAPDAMDREARRIVSKVDPAERPYFLLTPDRRLRRYDAGDGSTETLARVVFGGHRGGPGLAMRVPGSATDRSLVLGDATTR